MPLVTCKVCKKEMSASADVCPHCAHPHAKDRKAFIDNVQIFLLLGLVLLVIILQKTGLLAKRIDILPALGIK